MAKFLFAIRDDDTCYYTQPEELEFLYKEIWDIAPVSLSVVPFGVALHKDKSPFNVGYKLNDSPQPLEKNEELVNFLKEQVKGERIEIMLHGYSHKYKNLKGKWIGECR